jgi:RNA-directed DNA polymerase
VPCVADRVAQTVATAPLEKAVEPRFHPDSHGHRPGRSALDAARVCRKRCREYNWVIDLDIRKFFDSVQWDLTVEAVEAHTDHETRWVAGDEQDANRLGRALHGR